MQLNAQSYTFSNQIVKSFSVQKNATLDVYNKYGKIHFITWDKDSVNITIDYFISANKFDKLEKMKQSVNFDFVPSKYFVSAKTQLGNKSQDIVQNINDMFTIFGSSIQIDYTIKIPADINLKIENKFGDIYIDDVLGTVILNISNGDFKANNLGGSSNDLDLSFGNSSITNIKNARITGSYEDIYIKNCNKISLNTKSSKITIDDAEEIKINAKRDKYYIGNVNNLSGISTFTDFLIRNLYDQVLFDYKYGNVHIDNISKKFSTIKTTSKYTDFRLYFDKTSSFDVDISQTNGNLNFEKDAFDIKQTVVTESKKTYSVGKIGTQNTNAKLSMNAELGNIDLIVK
jgi:hypothetical protein